ncbi:NAD(P)/FAD-dependent oxidoreductase [Geomonas sp. RF6]|uniref:NAD(P)/FAD-dependent oxidoreductase n=1 Tax=Geomonas sp. RF6 TaxID=2897342 RepID=UPI001E2A022D|nr:NAD(P)/FAD-dependent oxidoreductase [Geomonas sp. RF6]UFS68615.1 NAD(P)/FAD-dependent oxidoreductase [Geomonas sp. RF6]
MHDVLIAGGGIAGLSAALILGRCRRDVVVYDSGKPRNFVSKALHGFISRDGINPIELRDLARKELANYPSVRYVEGEIVDAQEIEDGYEVELSNGAFDRGKFLLIATGVVDVLPEVPGLERFYGHNVFHCPYCDGWEMRDQPLAVYGAGETGYEYALELIGWSKDVILCTDGGEPLSAEQTAHLGKHGIAVITEKIMEMRGEEGKEIRLMYRERPPLSRKALFFNPAQYQASPLAEKLGCHVTGGGVVEAGKFQQTKARLFVAGDAARSVQLAIVAASEGVEAAFALNTALQKEATEK